MPTVQPILRSRNKAGGYRIGVGHQVTEPVVGDLGDLEYHANRVRSTGLRYAEEIPGSIGNSPKLLSTPLTPAAKTMFNP